MVSVGLTSQHRPKKIRFGAHSLRQRASEHEHLAPSTRRMQKAARCYATRIGLPVSRLDVVAKRPHDEGGPELRPVLLRRNL
jgi:hypothetical protein